MSFKDKPDGRMSDKDWLTLIDAMAISLANEIQWTKLDAGGIDVSEFVSDDLNLVNTRIMIRCFNAELIYDDEMGELWKISKEKWSETDFSSLVYEIICPMVKPIFSHKFSLNEAACICATYLYHICRGEDPRYHAEYSYINKNNKGMLAWYHKKWKNGYKDADDHESTK